MRIMVLGGFLGSGKTSVLLQLAAYLTERDGGIGEKQIAIIENEIGQIGIDDKILRGKGFSVKDIFAGCVCCSLNGDLLDGIRELQEELDPKWLIIEATGIAFPDKIASSIQESLGISAQLIVLVDTSRWQRVRIPMANLIEGQLKEAQFILLNKIDLTDEENLQSTEAEIRQINEDATILRVSGIENISEKIWQVIIDG